MFLYPLGLLALGAVPLVVGLHLFRRRFRPHAVSALFLWAAQDRLSFSGRRRERLRNNASFWCELLAALLLALAFAGPRVLGAGRAQHLVVVLDHSASMAASIDGVRQSERARALVRQRFKQLPSGSRVTLLTSGRRPQILSGPAAFASEALAALERWSPSAPKHGLESAVALGLQFAGDGSVLLVTDTLVDGAWPAEVEVEAIGKSCSNVAITHASRRRIVQATGEVRERIDLALHNFSGDAVRTTLTLRVEAGALEERLLELGAGERELVSLLLPPACPLVEAHLGEDALAIDNQAFLAPVPPRTLAVASFLSAETAAALGLSDARDKSSPIARLLAILPDTIEAPSVEGAHLVFCTTPAPQTSAWSLELHPSPGPAEAWIGPFLMDRRHPLLDGVTLDGVVWAASKTLVLPGVPLVSAGETVLVSEEESASGRSIHLALNAQESTLQRSPDWPILLSNLAEMRRAMLPGPARTSLALGESFRYHAQQPAQYTLSGPAGERKLEARAVLELDDMEGPGVYSLSGAAGELCRIGLSFCDAAESDLRQLHSASKPTTSVNAKLNAGFSWIEFSLVSLAICAILLDWFVLARSHSRADEALLARASVEVRP